MGLYERYVFPWLVEKALSREKATAVRRELLAGAHGEVLDVGFGTGLNLPHYPAAVRRVTGVDVNPGMNRRAARRIAGSGVPVVHREADVQQLPMEDDTFDTAVSTWTLCSVPDVDRALREIRRVLRPGGTLLFVEHGLSNEPSVRRWQHRLNGLERFVGCGCNLDRNFTELIGGQGFELRQIREYYMPDDPRTHGYTYQGVAAKA